MNLECMSAEFLSRAVCRSCIHFIEEDVVAVVAVVAVVVVVVVGTPAPISLSPPAEGKEDMASRKEETGTGAQVAKNTVKRMERKEMVGDLPLLLECVCVNIYEDLKMTGLDIGGTYVCFAFFYCLT